MIKNDEFMGQWRQKALENQENEPMQAKLTEKMIDYTVRELHSYANLVDSTSGITHACDDAVFWFKSIANILGQVRQLEDIPEEAKERCSDSRDHVLDLVDPSLYPIVYGKSYIREDGKTKIIESPSETNAFTSPNFCWIPSDFAIAKDGTAKLISPHINNIHPSNTSIMNTIEKLVTVFVPMWERVLGSVDRRERPDRLFNERIVPIGIYYDSSNITPSHLSLRTGIHDPTEHCHDDHICTKWLYDIDSDSPLLQERGSVPTEENTCIGFPNIYQHQASSFKLADLARSGHTKMVTLFLVDPFHRIPSATEVGMQQEDWVKELPHLRGSGDGDIGVSSRFGALPLEIKDRILDKTEGLINRKEAKETRLELM
ncbi:hypothetical protein DL96DRAFT_1821099 [Flagelloscypha sp. PMI_526]|nr:hypothetical protein DL96DRAFT_1821099 [Flagelloscypha sp. PMI_526]